MMYPFMTLDDGTEIVHSEMREDGQVKVYLERPDAKEGFHHATCWLPGYIWEDVFGFSDRDMERFQEVVRAISIRGYPAQERRRDEQEGLAGSEYLCDNKIRE